MQGLSNFMQYLFMTFSGNLLSVQKYCDLCADHTVCLYPNTGPSANCTDLIAYGLLEAEKQSIVKLHNQLRQRVAQGLETRGSPGPQPAARYMPDLVWDNELAAMAQRWANTCRQSVDSCRNTERFPVGQSVGYRGTTGNAHSLRVTSIVQDWYDQVVYHDGARVSAGFRNRGADQRYVGTYTQIVWADTSYVGCGSTRYRDGRYNTLYLVCNYGPSGNIVGYPIYRAR
ncbi:venom allergen 5-like [Trichogramma pretiosum]|uniref:venom allergen 5-like n=1 Tax=Trichogramma pretiosum TaxID=7493 RepID=UPI0006C9690D|nr:venom allergen 5-like [Trichogramma pretiosum]